ncbi:FAD-dependent oxidoreductase [Halovivax sp.]|uniref:FAD-dependent oxidoreductase n=1 Tax=Halovivax sp. TaxID=1935978 RepID=UPI0025C367B0|nr:FAD-dependent oxidoreductase [Halovivax sp.]
MEYGPLFDPIDVGGVTLRNRIMTSGHQTTLVEDHLPTDAFDGYHLARARGGAGLIVLEAHAVDESGLLTSHTIDASSDRFVDRYEPFAESIREEGAALFAQLFHGGRERYASGYAPPAPAPSPIPTDRLHVVPRPLLTEEVYDLIDAFAAAAERMDAAGLDGVEIVGSHGYLPAQFWSHRANERGDEFGGDLEGRCRFTVEIVERIRERTADEFVVGVRLSAEERHRRGLSLEETLPIVERVDGACEVDYWSVVVGSSSTHRSCRYIVPPAAEDHAITRGPAEAIGRLVDEPVMVTSRIDAPEKAVELLGNGVADVVGMTRALIADPALPRKVREGERTTITPCVACNQGCIGRYQEGLPIRCTVNPRTGRETEWTAQPDPARGADDGDRVLIVGGGPAGMTCAATAAERGHDVTLFERASELGGQVRTYADLAHRGAFDRWIDALERRLRDAGVEVRLNEPFDHETVEPAGVGAVVLATGATARIPDVEIDDAARVFTPADILADPERVRGASVIVSDWDGNWASLDVATACSRTAAEVELVSETYAAGENVQQYRRNELLGRLQARDVSLTGGYRVVEVADGGAILESVYTERREPRRAVDAVVFSHGGEADHEPYETLCDRIGDTVAVRRVGDCWAPRSLDEAVREGFEIGAGL